MADTLATIGFKAETSDLVKADKALSNLESTAASTEKQIKVAESGMKSMGAASAAQAAQVQRFVQALQDEAATIGLNSKELALYKANQMGATQADKQAIVAAIDKIEAYERSAAAAKANAAATAQMGGAYGGARGVMQSFGYQLQDTIVQAQMGANAFMILSQQGSQMASAFGPSGAVVGALIAVAGVAGMVLAPSLMDSKTNAEKLADAMNALGQAAERNEDGVLQLTNEIKELAKQSDLAARAQLQAVMIKSAEAMSLASKAAADMVDSLTGAGFGLYDVSDAISQLGSVTKTTNGYLYVGVGTGKAFYETVEEIGNKMGKTGAEARDLGVDVLKAIKSMSEAETPEAINTAREYLLQTAQAAKMSEKELAEFIVTINQLASDGISAAETAKLLSGSLEDGSIAASSAKDKLKELTQQALLAKEEFLYGEAAAQKLAHAFDLGFTSAKQLTPELSAQVDELIKWQKAGKEVEEQIRRIAKAEQDMEDAFGGEDMLTEVYQNRAKAAEKLMDEWSEGVDTFEEDNKRAISISEKAAERIEEAFAGAWMNAFDGFESVVDGMKNAFKRMLAEMAHMALTRPIMVSMGLGGMLPGGASASALGGASSAMSGLGLLGGIGSGLIGAGSMIGGAFGGGLMGGGALVGAGQFGTLFSGAGSLFGSGNIAAGLGMSMPIILAGLAGAAGLNKLTGGGLFGTSFKTTGQSLGLSLGGGDVTGSITTEESKKRSLFRGTKRRTTTTGYDASAIDDAFDAISESLLAAATTFGIEGADAVIKGFASSVNIDIKDKTEAEIQDAIAAWVGSTTEGLVNAVFGNSLDGLQKEGEGVIDTVNRLAANMQAVTNISDVLGINFGLTGKAAMVAATNIVEFAGGLDQLSALSTQYYQSFYSEAEQQANLAAQLSESFAALNVSMPDTREGFRALVDGLDLTSEAGQKMFAELMKLVPGMDQYLTALEAQRQASEDAAEAARKEAEAKAEALKAQGLDLQLRLYDALGQSSEALALRRQMELDATDETLRALLLQIYAAEDAAAAQRELAESQEAAAKLAQQRQSLEIQLLEASGQSAQALAMQRQIELEAMDESLRGLQQNVWAALDAAAAQKELAEAQAEAAAKAEELLVQRQSMEIELLNATGRTAEATAMRRSIELSAMDESLRALQQQIWAANDATEAQRALAEAQKAAAESARDAVQNAFGKLQDSADLEKQRLKTELDAKLSAIQAESDAINKQKDAVAGAYAEQSAAVDSYMDRLSSLNDVINEFLSDTTEAVNPFKRLGQIFNEVKAGLLPTQEELSAVLSGVKSAGSSGFSSAFEQNRAMAIAKNQAAGIQSMIGGQMSEAERQVELIQVQIFNAERYYSAELGKLDDAAELAQKQHDEQVALIDSQLSEAQKQLNALLGIDDRILSMADALAEFYAAINNASSLQQSSAEKALDSAITSASLSQVEAIYQSAAESSMTQVEAIYESVAVQVEAINNVAIAIEQLGEQIIEINKPEDRVWVPPTMPVSFTNEGTPVTREMIDLLTQILNAQESTAKHTKTTADVVKLNQFEAQEAAL